jgi:hypothetical protein
MSAFGELTFSLADSSNILLTLGVALGIAWCARRELWTIFRALASVAENPGRKVTFARDRKGRITAAHVIEINATDKL